MSIKLNTNSKKHRATVKLLSYLLTFSFEQKYDEIETWSNECVDTMTKFINLLKKEIE